MKDFYKRIKNNFFVQIIKEIFKLIVKAKEHKQFKSCSQVALNLSDALISENQSDMKVELSKVLRNIIGVMTGSIEDSTYGLSSHRSSNALNQMQMAYNRTNKDGSVERGARNNSSMRSRKSSPGVDKMVPDINDQMRVQMAKDLSS